MTFDVTGELWFPAISVGQQLFLVVEQLFVIDSGVLVVGALHNGVNRTGLLAIPAIYALCHVDIVAGSSPRPIRTRLAFYGDGSGRASCSA